MSSGTDKKSKLHPRNKNRNLYNLESLIQCKPSLANYIKPNKAGNPSIDFSNPEAVKILNKALLHHYYGVEYWEFPDANLCPPIPGRVDYLHYIADLLRVNNSGEISKNNITCLDIGMGASCIYPILGVTEYDWNFIGSDIAEKSIANAKNIIASNPQLKGKIECIQEYPITNHINWAFNQKPSDVVRSRKNLPDIELINKKYSQEWIKLWEKFSNSYKDFLLKRGFSDRIWCEISKIK